MPDSKANLIRSFSVALAYLAAASLAVALARYEGGASVVWTAGPILFSALSLRPRHEWPLPILFCLLAAVAVTALVGAGAAAAMPMACVHVAEAFSAAWLVRKAFPRFGRFSTSRETFCLLLIAGVLVPGVTAFPGALLLGRGVALSFWTDWRDWFLSHAVGYIAFAPLFVLILRGDIADWRRGAEGRTTLEAGALLTLVAAVAAATFGQSNVPLLAVPFVPLMIATLRFGVVGAVVSIALVILIATGCALAGLGPTTLIHGSVTLRLQVLELYFATIVLVILPTAAELRSRKRLFERLGDAEAAARAAQAAISRSEARYRALAESTSDMITRLSLPGLCRTYVSPACRTLVGYEPDEMLARNPLDDIHPEDAAQIHMITTSFSAGGAFELPPAISYRVRHKLGHWLWVETSLSFSRSDTGEVDGLICSIRDIIGRRRAEAARDASEARFRLLAENASELIVLGFDTGLRSYISPASTRLVGFTPAELEVEMRGKRWVHPDDLDFLANATLAPSNAETKIACRVRRKDGEWIWVEAIFRRIASEGDGEPTVIATFRDITERQLRAQALRDAKDAADVARTAAEQASRAKSDFLATMSHEIRTPLNAILGFADLLQGEASLSENARRHLGRIQNAGAALRSVVDDILDFSKFEAGELHLKSSAFCPAALVDSVSAIVRGLAQSKKLDLVVSIDSNAPALLQGDDDRLRQILVNLLNNAIKFTRHGSISLSLECTGTSTGKADLRFQVADTGLGIPPDKLTTIFQRFSQVDNSISREFGGTGLGLAICRSLVEAMGGTIGVESAVGKGSSFWFDVSLPVADAVVSEPAARGSLVPLAGAAEQFDDLVSFVCEPEAPKVVSTRPLYPTRRLAILLVEDVILNQELILAILQVRGHEVDVVGNGAEAIMAVEDRRYDLVLMDVQMPCVDGLTATRAIRNLGAPCRFVPIVALTAAVLREQTEAALMSGMNGVLAKPVVLSELDAVLDRVARGALLPSLDPDLLDTEVLDQLARAIGDAKVRSMQSLLVKSLTARFTVALSDETAAMLKAEAHASIAGAAMLGFVRFGTACRAFIGAQTEATEAAYHALRCELHQVVRMVAATAPEDASLSSSICAA